MGDSSNILWVGRSNSFLIILLHLSTLNDLCRLGNSNIYCESEKLRRWSDGQEKRNVNISLQDNAKYNTECYNDALVYIPLLGSSGYYKITKCSVSCGLLVSIQ